MTLTKSYTTRRSQPMMRSRLRRPTSKSITAVLKPRSARPLAIEALVVVLPTPPLPEVTVMMVVTELPFFVRLERFDDDLARVGQADLRRLLRHGGIRCGFEGAVHAGDRHEFRLQL